MKNAAWSYCGITIQFQLLVVSTQRRQACFSLCGGFTLLPGDFTRTESGRLMLSKADDLDKKKLTLEKEVKRLYSLFLAE